MLSFGSRALAQMVATVAVFGFVVSRVDADVIVTQWNFNGASSTTVPGGASSPTPSLGLGTASLVGGVVGNATFPSGTANGGSSDPVVTTPENYGWGTSTYPAQGTGNLTAGVQFAVSTLGFDNIVVDWDTRSSNTASRFQQFQYSIDGTNFINFGTLFENTGGDTWFNNRVVDLSGIAGVNNNPNFAFRMLSAFDPVSGTGYLSSNPASTYAPTGTLRFDMVTVTSVPEPTSLSMLGVAAIGLVVRRRRKA